MEVIEIEKEIERISTILNYVGNCDYGYENMSNEEYWKLEAELKGLENKKAEILKR